VTKLPARIDAADAAYVLEQLEQIQTKRLLMKVSEWAEKHRYLPRELTPKPGFWDNLYAPYLTEIMDTMSVDDPTRKCAVMKAGQVCATTGLLENTLGYTISHAPRSVLYMTADKELARMGMELKIDRMLDSCGLRHLLGAPGGTSKRSGDTSERKEFPGGFLLGIGARNPGKMRQMSVPIALIDELDAFPLILGGKGQEEGGVLELVEKRTDVYNAMRKILYLSSPLLMQTSQIYPLFMAGDQRRYYVPCRHCGEMQHLEWHAVNAAGQPYGIVWSLDDHKHLVEESVRYVCMYCQKAFYNYDKTWFLQRGEWRAHSEPEEKGLTSYHIPALLSPAGMYPWHAMVYKWLKAWDVDAGHARDHEKLQTFYNLELGRPWEERGVSPKKERVELHRRAVYSEGEIPNKVAELETGAPVILLTCAVDVHGDRLDVEVVGWCRDRQTYSIEWLHFEATPDHPITDLSAQGPWEPLRHLILDKVWEADDGRLYRLANTLIDVGFMSDVVHEFCRPFQGWVYPVMGRAQSIRESAIKEFSLGESSTGSPFYNVTATIYKNRMGAWLEQRWDDTTQRQPVGYPNYPQNRPGEFFAQYEAEEKIKLLDRVSKRHIGYVWEQIGQRPNHAWDCRIYNMCAFDMLVYEYCTKCLELEKIDYDAFADVVIPKRNHEEKWFPSPYSYHPQEVVR